MVLSMKELKETLAALEQFTVLSRETNEPHFKDSKRNLEERITRSHQDLLEVYEDRVSDIDGMIESLREIDQLLNDPSKASFDDLQEKIRAYLPEHHNDY